MTGRSPRRRDTLRRLLAAVLGLAAVLCLVAGLRGSSDAAAGGTTPDGAASETPVWSPRRVPQPFVDAVGATNLQLTLDELAAGTDACFRVDVAGHGTVARGGDTTPVIPASTEKVLTAAGALGVLGPEFTFATTALARTTPANGAVDQLWLVGGGDPLLSTPEWIAASEQEPHYAGLTGTFTKLAALADSIVAAGVRSIPLGVAGDASQYSTPAYLPSWPESYRLEIGPLGALVVDDGFDPVTGQPVADPALAAAATLSGMLTARGVAVGPPSTGTAPDGGAEIAVVRSAPLPDLVTELLVASDNGTSEALALAVGEATAGTGTVEAGMQGILDSLAGSGVDLAGVTLADASGLSRENRVTCGALLQTLDLGVQPRYRSVVDGLAVAGQSGTLGDRFVGTPLQGRLAGKTGTLNGVSGLVGLFDRVDGAGSPRFASVFNGSFSQDAGIVRTAEVAEAVAAYPQSPPANDLVPAP